MTDLRRLVWRFQEKAILLEEVRDRFEDEIARLRARYRELVSELQLIASVNKDEARISLAIEEAALKTEGNVRSALFSEAYRSLQLAGVRLEEMEEMCLARKSLGLARQQISRLDALLPTGLFSSAADSSLMLANAVAFYNRAEYRKSRVSADLAAQNVDRLLSTEVPRDEVPKSLRDALQRQYGIARGLDVWDPDEAHRTRTAVDAIERVLARGYVQFAAMLLQDLEIETGPIEAFLAQVRTREGETPHSPAVQALVTSPGKRINWVREAARLAEESLSEMSARMAQRALTAGSGA